MMVPGDLDKNNCGTVKKTKLMRVGSRKIGMKETESYRING